MLDEGKHSSKWVDFSIEPGQGIVFYARARRA